MAFLITIEGWSDKTLGLYAIMVPLMMIALGAEINLCSRSRPDLSAAKLTERKK